MVTQAGQGLAALRTPLKMLQALSWEKLHIGHWKDVALVGGCTVCVCIMRVCVRVRMWV